MRDRHLNRLTRLPGFNLALHPLADVLDAILVCRYPQSVGLPLDVIEVVPDVLFRERLISIPSMPWMTSTSHVPVFNDVSTQPFISSTVVAVTGPRSHSMYGLVVAAGSRRSPRMMPSMNSASESETQLRVSGKRLMSTLRTRSSSMPYGASIENRCLSPILSLSSSCALSTSWRMFGSSSDGNRACETAWLANSWPSAAALRNSSQLSAPGPSARGRPEKHDPAAAPDEQGWDSSERTGTYGTAPTVKVLPLSRSFASAASTLARLLGFGAGRNATRI